MPSKKGNLYPYAPVPELFARRDKGERDDGEEPVDRSLLRRDGPDCRDTEGSSFYGSRGPRRANGALGGNEAVPHKVLANATGGSAQTYYFSSRPEFFRSSEYEDDQGTEA